MSDLYVYIELTVSDAAWVAFNDAWLDVERIDGVSLESWENGPVITTKKEEGD